MTQPESVLTLVESLGNNILGVDVVNRLKNNILRLVGYNRLYSKDN
jgi:hypothetical protein